MWPYRARGSRVCGDPREQWPSKLATTRFNRNDAVIKLWLPERLIVGVDVLSDAHNISRPDVLRWLLFEHVYGRVEFEHLRDRELRRRVGDPIDDEPMFSRKDLQSAVRTARLYFLGKSESDFKLTLPSALKADLERLAADCGESLSSYVRRVLARALLPETEYRHWQDPVNF